MKRLQKQKSFKCSGVRFASYARLHGVPARIRSYQHYQGLLSNDCGWTEASWCSAILAECTNHWTGRSIFRRPPFCLWLSQSWVLVALSPSHFWHQVKPPLFIWSRTEEDGRTWECWKESTRMSTQGKRVYEANLVHQHKHPDRESILELSANMTDALPPSYQDRWRHQPVCATSLLASLALRCVSSSSNERRDARTWVWTRWQRSSIDSIPSKGAAKTNTNTQSEKRRKSCHRKAGRWTNG